MLDVDGASLPGHLGAAGAGVEAHGGQRGVRRRGVDAYSLETAGKGKAWRSYLIKGQNSAILPPKGQNNCPNFPGRAALKDGFRPI